MLYHVIHAILKTVKSQNLFLGLMYSYAIVMLHSSYGPKFNVLLTLIMLTMWPSMTAAFIQSTIREKKTYILIKVDDMKSQGRRKSGVFQ